MTVEPVSNGGARGQGGHGQPPHVALAAWLLDRPVKCTLSRRRASASTPSATLCASSTGPAVTPTACSRPCEAAVGDSGAYAPVGMKVLERAAGHATGPYHVPAVDVESIARTNNLLCGALRGFGANQAQFAMDGVMDRLAAAVGISGWEMRKRNVIRPGVAVGPGAGDGRRRRRCGGVPRWHQARVRRGGRGGQGRRVGARPKNAGLGNGLREVSGAVVRFHGDDDRVEVRHGWTEMGQGVHTVAPRWPPRSSTSTRHASTSSSTPHASSASGRRQVHGTLMAAGAAGVRHGARRRLPSRRRLPRRARRRLDRQAR